jgi:hypothetical protein
MMTVVHGVKELQPFDLAIDPIGRLLFWTCVSQDVINVTRLNNDTVPDSIPFGVVVQNENEKPRHLAIHPTKRYFCTEKKRCFYIVIIDCFSTRTWGPRDNS